MKLLLMLLAFVPLVAHAEPESPTYAIWSHSDYKPWQSDVYARDPQLVLREEDWMRGVGINTYFPLAFASGRVNWSSPTLPDTRDLFGTRSPLDVAVQGGAERGIDVHLYFLMGFVGFLEDPWAAPDLRAHPEWDVIGPNGRGTLSGQAGTATTWGTFLWWDLGNPGVQDRILASLDEALERYPTVRGVHLDYVRDPGGGCFSDPCIDRFQQATGLSVPEEAPDRADYVRTHFGSVYAGWRAGEITALVRRVRQAVDAHRPGAELSTAVFADAAGAYAGVSQDWRRWATEGLIDAVYPMFYGDSRTRQGVGAYVRTTLADLDERASRLAGHRARLVLGLETAPYDVLAPEAAEAAIADAISNGADGIALEMLPYWWHAEYQQFRGSYVPQSDSWPPLWDYDASLARAFHAAAGQRIDLHRGPSLTGRPPAPATGPRM